MTKFKLTRKSKKQRPINLDQLLVAKLFIVDKEPYYISHQGDYLGGCRVDEEGNVCDFWNEKSKSAMKPQTIIIKKPKLIINIFCTPRYVKEYLTGVKIPFTYITDIHKLFIEQTYGLVNGKKESDMFVCIDCQRKNPTMEELSEYIIKHKNVDKYGLKLLADKKISRAKHKQGKLKEKIKEMEEEREKALLKTK